MSKSGSPIDTGMQQVVQKCLGDDGVRAFAEASGDRNPLHLDDQYASESRFEGRIAHGVLVQGVVSAAIERLPGCPILLETSAEYRDPVPVGSTVSAIVEVDEDLGHGQFRLQTRVELEDGTIVLSGRATVLLDDDPDVITGADRDTDTDTDPVNADD